MPEPTAPTPRIPIMVPADYARMAETIKKAGARILKEGEEKVKAEGVEFETLLREGRMVHEIVRTAEGGKFNIIIWVPEA